MGWIVHQLFGWWWRLRTGPQTVLSLVLLNDLLGFLLNSTLVEFRDVDAHPDFTQSLELKQF